MKLIILSIRDRAVNAFMRPFVARSAGEGIRLFNDEINRGDSEMNKHPDDYDLYKLGEFDEDTGKVTATTDGPEQIAIGKNAIIK